MITIKLIAFIVLLNYSQTCLAQKDEYLDEWVTEIPGGLEKAKRIAHEVGFMVKRKVNAFDDVYLMVRSSKPELRISKRDDTSMPPRTLANHLEVRWAQRQKILRRTKRDIFINDPEWKNQWYLHDIRAHGEQIKRDLHVLPVWEMGYTGKGVVVSVLDDGLEHNNTDIIDNYDPKASYDFNDGDFDPFPRYDFTNENSHGTRCGSEIAMSANNQFCGVGVAYNAKLGGMRILDGDVTDLVESEALAFALDHIDIYVASWGPLDNGKTMEQPNRLTRIALEKGIRKGRNGLGVLYVWASGNGGLFKDDCGCDGYASSPYTISISSASESLNSPYFAERCASTIATTFGKGRITSIVAADLHNKCTSFFAGTSVSAPLGAGILALALEANFDEARIWHTDFSPKLNWRDVQHIIAFTSEWIPLQNDKGWYMNAAGFKVNNAFGFGLLNAKAIVMAAKSWKTVPKLAVCRTNIDFRVNRVPRAIKSHQEHEFNVNTTGCVGMQNEIQYLEHVQVFMTVEYNQRGSLSIDLISPSGTKSRVLSPRPRDHSKKGIEKFPFMSVHTWGENPVGMWRIIIQDKNGSHNHGEVRDIVLQIWGTKEKPAHYAKLPRTYNKNYNNVHNERSKNFRRRWKTSR